MVSLKELFSITDDHFGVFPVSANPYMRGTLISKEVVKNALGNLNGIPIHPVAISPTSDWTSKCTTRPSVTVMCDALTKPEHGKNTPPAVSSNEMKKRLKVELKTDHVLNLSHLFLPSLDEACEDEEFVKMLHSDVISLCSVASIHTEKLQNPETTSRTELTNEQELFANILQTIVEAPYCIHAQCQTIESSLPTAKFDLLVNHPVPDAGSSPATTCEVVMIVNGHSKEDADLVMSNKTDMSLNLHALNLSLVLEGLIFSQLNGCPAVRLISCSQSFIRPIFSFKQDDCLLTLRSVMRWWNNGNFDIMGCVLLVLCIKAGTGRFPKLDANFVNSVAPLIDIKCGWNKAYGELGEKYSNQLQQTKPRVRPAGRGASIVVPKRVATESKKEFIKKLRLS